ncbi:hypothetical protein [Undibacterium sp. Di24W]|uniref:hypothetical protein n=1 Tax=Undibacterium sp. Di24W TaxID=3413033 RepID=UPI003BF1290F
MNIWIAALAAVLIQPIVMLLRLAPDYLASPQPLNGIGLMIVAILAVASAAVLILGIPTFLALRKLGKDSWLSMASAGLILGALPNVFFWPRQMEGYSAGHNWHGTYVDTYIDGIPTNYAWLSYAEGVFFMAMHGLAGALIFYVILRGLNRSQSASKPKVLTAHIS